MPQGGEALLAEADRQHHARAYAAAVAAYRAAVAASPGLFAAWMGLGCALAAQEEHGAAVTALRRALALRPGEAWLRVNLGQSLFELGRVSAAVVQYERAVAEGDEEVRHLAMHNIACIAPGDPALDNAGILRVRRRWAEYEAKSVRPLLAAPKPGPRLRLAYYGAFFARKNWMKMYIRMINAHDRERFEINLIVDGALPCAEAGYVEHASDRIWQVDGMPNPKLAQAIAAEEIEVLVDLNGYSHQRRLPLLLHRAAPVQLAWQGMYGTTGFPGLAAIVGDPWTIPPEEEAFCTEPVRRVANSYLPFDVFYPTPDVVPPPCLAAGHITFGSLSSGYKVTDPVVALWARILHRVQGAKLLLGSRGLATASNRADLLSRFAEHGIEAARLELHGGGEHDDFLRVYDRIDIALDAFPYSGGTTTAEALWQGVPVVTYQGDRWAARTSRSLLMAAGLGDYVAADLDGYAELAVALAADPARLAARRATQRAQLAASPACDPASLCRELEALYLTLAGR